MNIYLHSCHFILSTMAKYFDRRLNKFLAEPFIPSEQEVIQSELLANQPEMKKDLSKWQKCLSFVKRIFS